MQLRKYSGSPRKYDVDANSTELFKQFTELLPKIIPICWKSKPGYKTNIGICDNDEAKMILVSWWETSRFGIYLSNYTKYDKSDIILYESAPRIISLF